MKGLLLFFFCSASTVVWCEVQRIAGTNVSMDVPAGFISAPGISGVQQATSDASIMVSEMPTAVTEVSASLTAEGFAARSMQLIGKSTVIVDGNDAQLLEVRQTHRDIPYQKWMLLLGDEAASVLVVGTFPAANAADVGLEVKRAVMSVSLDVAGGVARFEGLPFRVGETADLKYADRISNVMFLTLRGEVGQRDPAYPVLVVASATGSVPIDDLADFSRQRLAQTENVLAIEELEAGGIEVDGDIAYELLVNAAASADATPLAIYQVVVPHGASYIIVQGTVAATLADKYVKQFRELVHGMKFKT
jgi:hypothetical protein